jgi:hypothetical protein
MESRDYTGGFESFLQEKADQYKLYPSDRVWNAINGKLHPRKKWSYLFVAAIFIGLGIGGKVHDSSFLQGFEQGAELETYTNTEIADLAPVIPISKSSPSKKTSGADAASNTSGKLPRSSGFEQLLMTSQDLAAAEEFVDEVEIQTPGNNELVKVIVADGDHLLIDGNREVESIPTEKLYAKQPEAEATTEAGHTSDESFVESHSDSHKINAFASVPVPATGLGTKDITATHLAAPEKATSIRILKPRHLNLGWQLYLSPTVSYRRLSGEGMKYYNGFSVANSPDVNNSVTHKPSIGFEIGTALTFATGRNFRLKTGVQLNVNQYDVQAFYFTPEVAPLTRGGIGHTEINVISRFRNFNGFSKTWLTNKHIMMSVPLGAELTIAGNEKVKFNIAGTLQPTFVLNNQAYMISTNMKNYAQEPSLYNKFNVAAGAEAYISIKAGSYKWMIGPQFRYQIFSSYKKEYPITEHLMDYGFKIGITR